MVSFGICTICNGSGRAPCPNTETRDYGLKHGWYGYNKETDTVDCRNCGAQYMFGKPKGKVPLRKDGTPCSHEYKVSPGLWKCTHNYDCLYCGDHFMIDSGD